MALNFGRLSISLWRFLAYRPQDGRTECTEMCDLSSPWTAHSTSMDSILGVSRFTFGNVNLFDGFEFIPFLIGLLALSEVFVGVERHDFEAEYAAGAAKAKWPSFAYYWKLRMSMLRASIIGTLVGIFPGAGATIATFISYDVEKRLSKTPEAFGEGVPEGVAAAEAANSSSVGGAMVPMLTLGIPGSATAAVLLGALMIHNLQPGRNSS